MTIKKSRSDSKINIEIRQKWRNNEPQYICKYVVRCKFVTKDEYTKCKENLSLNENFSITHNDNHVLINDHKMSFMKFSWNVAISSKWEYNLLMMITPNHKLKISDIRFQFKCLVLTYTLRDVKVLSLHQCMLIRCSEQEWKQLSNVT